MFYREEAFCRATVVVFQPTDSRQKADRQPTESRQSADSVFGDLLRNLGLVPLISTEASLIQEVSGVYSSPLLDTQLNIRCTKNKFT